jgi:hypothetical protein
VILLVRTELLATFFVKKQEKLQQVVRPSYLWPGPNRLCIIAISCLASLKNLLTGRRNWMFWRHDYFLRHALMASMNRQPALELCQPLIMGLFLVRKSYGMSLVSVGLHPTVCCGCCEFEARPSS